MEVDYKMWVQRRVLYKILKRNRVLCFEISFRNLWILFEYIDCSKIFHNVSSSQQLLLFLSSSFRIERKSVESKKIQRRFMAKGKDIRITVILECTTCVRKVVNKASKGISRYMTQKNRHNTPNRLELRKFCPYCYKHTIHGEITKQLEPSTCTLPRRRKNAMLIIAKII